MQSIFYQDGEWFCVNPKVKRVHEYGGGLYPDHWRRSFVIELNDGTKHEFTDNGDGDALRETIDFVDSLLS